MTDKPTRCTECDRPCRGPVDASDGVPAHWCRQCAEHCQMTAYLRERKAGHVQDVQDLGVRTSL